MRRGIELLDQERPGWRSEINVRFLDMSAAFNVVSPEGCILTQLYGTYGRGLERLGLTWPDGKPDYNKGADLGFDLGVNDSYHALTRAWKDEIEYFDMQ